MTATPSTLALTGFGSRLATLLVVAVFVAGVLTGLVGARLLFPTVGSTAGDSAVSNQTWQIYDDFRSGERDVPIATFTVEQLQQAWLDFRAGEREAAPSR